MNRNPTQAREDMFQYDSPIVYAKSLKGDVYELDGAKLNAIIRKAWSAYDVGWRYQIGGSVDPALEAKFIVEKDPGTKQTDCSGYCWWSSYRKRLGTMYPSNDFYKEIADFIPGASIRYAAQPGNTFGHAIMIVGMLPGGQLETLDMTQDSGYSGIFYRGPGGKYAANKQISKKTANESWMKSDRVGGTHSVISTDTIISINGVPYKPKKLNVALAAAAQPIRNWVGLAITVSTILYFYAKYSSRSNRLSVERDK